MRFKKWKEMDGNTKYMEMDGMDGSRQKWIEIDGTGWNWMEWTEWM